MSISENSLKADVADLRAAAVKLSTLNEALALDKVRLNQQLLQVSNNVLDSQRRAEPFLTEAMLVTDKLLPVTGQSP